MRLWLEKTITSSHLLVSIQSAASTNADDESESGSEDSDYVPVDDWKKVGTLL